MKIHTFIRHCNFSSNSVGKNRPIGFSREKCWKNFNVTLNPDVVEKPTVIFDAATIEETKDHFLSSKDNDYDFNLVCLKGGTDGHSFLNVVNHISSLKIDDDDIVYITEDDYLHAQGWSEIMINAFESMEIDYVTLYDHYDKYFLPMYSNLTSTILATGMSHWRTTPSTTNTYACKFKTFMKHLDIHKQFCDLQRGFTRDHDKFTYLWQNGSNLISSIPGYSTHCEVEYMSPVIDWSKYLI